MTPDAPPFVGAMMLAPGGKKWTISADPHVLIGLKRWFQKIDKSELGEVTITRNAEVDADLQWMLEKFPLELSVRDAAELTRGAEEHRARGRLISRTLAPGYEPQAFSMAVQPRDYQRLAADLWLKSGGLLLADDTGVGKTISAITGLSDARTLPALVACPGGHMPVQWREQIARCLPGLRVYVCKGQTPTDLTTLPGGVPDVVICPYHLLQFWGDVLLPVVKSIVYDEVQDLRHSDTAKYRSARALSGSVSWILGMSATPSYNYGSEYHAILDAIRPGCLGSWEEYDREWLTGDEKRKKRVTDPAAFGLYLDKAGIRLRRTRRDVGRELPPLTISPTRIGCDVAELARVAGRASELAKILITQSLGRGAGLQKMQAAGELDRLMRQATGIGKAPFVAEFVRLLVENGEPCVVFVHHRSVYEILGERLDDYKPAIYSGAESHKQKEHNLGRFLGKETPILIMGLRVGSAGLDGLQHVCRTVVIAELDWSPALHHQAISRVDRDGQTDPVTAYYLLADDGSDPTVAEVCGAKKAQQVVISDPILDRRAQEAVDVNRAEKLAAAYLKRTRR